MKSQQFIYFNFKSLFYICLVLICATSFGYAQKTSVESYTELVGKVQRNGLKTSLAFEEKKVAKAWKDYLQNVGKVTVSKGTYEVENAKIPAISPQPIRITSKVVEESNTNSYVFCSFDVGTGYITSADSRYGAAEKFLKDFALKMYRDEFGDQVAAAEKIFTNSQKNQEKLVEKDADWAKQIQNSEQDVIEMEKKILDKKAKIVEFNRLIEENKTTKTKAVEETELARKNVEQMKLKLGEIN